MNNHYTKKNNEIYLSKHGDSSGWGNEAGQSCDSPVLIVMDKAYNYVFNQMFNSCKHKDNPTDVKSNISYEIKVKILS